jgi:hypothetical protein
MALINNGDGMNEYFAFNLVISIFLKPAFDKNSCHSSFARTLETAEDSAHALERFSVIKK